MWHDVRPHLVEPPHAEQGLVRWGIGAGALGAIAGGAAYGTKEVLTRQAAIARSRIGDPLGHVAPSADKTYKKRYGQPIDLLVLGDSIAAGLGADHPKHTLGGGLSQARREADRASGAAADRGRGGFGEQRARRADRGAARRRTGPTWPSSSSAATTSPTGSRPPTRSAHLTEAIAALQELGAEVVVGTCPDLGALRPVPQPLRALGSRASRQLAQAQREAALTPRALERCRWRPSSGRSSSPTPTRCSASTGSTPAPTATSERRRRCCPRCWRRWATPTTCRSATTRRWRADPQAARSTGSPCCSACSQSSVISTTSRPARASRLAAMAARKPLLQCTHT